jgi:hypothetical protein
MSKQESSNKSRWEGHPNQSLYDRWDADAAGWRMIGVKEDWQEYPCIIAHSKEYALIAYSEDKGKIIDVEGQTVEECDPRTCWNEGSKYRGVLVSLGYGVNDRDHAEYLFWKSKYPELLTR